MEKTFKMRSSQVLKKIRNGDVALCTKLNLADSRACEIAAMSGFDCLWTGQEHIANDYKTINEQILAAKVYDCDVLCRVPKGSYSDYIRPLELDATGIMIPHVMSVEEAKSIVQTTRFHPIGKRPVDGGNADGRYCQVPFADYLKQANEERFTVLQIEDHEALEELDAIAELEGYNMLFFGPGDFTQSIGDPGNFNNPLVNEARIKIAETANKYGKIATTVGSVENYKELVDMGYKFISIGADVCSLSAAYKNIIETVSGINTKANKSIYGQ
jgi:4-hydroxy-2-oxoheptanedioate aldolase